MKSTLLAAIAALTLLLPARSRAHCDTLDGPVVSAARTALDTGELEPVLAWVQPSGERELRDAFAKARAARQAGKDAREVADRWFFETLVRVHRAGEGAPYTGLKPAGAEADPAVAAADRAVASGDPSKVEALLVAAVRDGLRARWARLRAEKPPAGDVAAGRRWVGAYVPFVHWAEAVRAAAAGGGGHGADAGHETEARSGAPAPPEPAPSAHGH